MVPRRGNPTNHEWALGNGTIPQVDRFVHLGLEWVQGKKAPEVAPLIKSARRAAYALMKIGLHGTDGLGPLSSTKIIRTFITQGFSMA